MELNLFLKIMKTIQEILAQATQQLDKIYKSAKDLINKVSAHKATPSMVKDIPADHYGVLTPIGQIATISIPNTTTIHITPWDKKLLQKIQEAIVKAHNPDLNPQNTGEIIRISLPPLTGERRTQLTKNVQKEVEQTKIKIRQERKKTNKQLEDLKTEEGISEDEIKRNKTELQKLIDKYITKIDELQAEIIKQVNKI